MKLGASVYNGRVSHGRNQFLQRAASNSRKKTLFIIRCPSTSRFSSTVARSNCFGYGLADAVGGNPLARLPSHEVRFCSRYGWFLQRNADHSVLAGRRRGG